MKTIDSFDGEYRFLSNFWPSIVKLDGVEYTSVEHAYQAAKTLDENVRLKIKNAKTAGIAKRMGRKLKKENTQRQDWENVNLGIMLDLLRQKFAIPELRQSLLDTGDVELVEGNYWNDTFFGVCNGEGLNHLGKMLMQIRKELKDQQ